MKNELITTMLTNDNASREFIEYLEAESKIESYKKGKLLLKKGEVCQRIWFLAQGLAKSRYFDENGKQHVTRFWKESEIIVAKVSFNQRVPATKDIILLEDATLLSLDYLQVMHVYNAYPESHTLIRRVHVADEHQYRLRSHLLTLSVQDAYKQFCDAFSAFPYSRLQQQDIAAYINRTSQSISKVRAKKQ